MHVLELLVAFEGGGTLLRGHCTHCILEVAERAALIKLDLVVTFTGVVQNGVDARDDATCVVQSARLLHVVVICDSRVTTLTITIAVTIIITTTASTPDSQSTDCSNSSR